MFLDPDGNGNQLGLELVWQTILIERKIDLKGVPQAPVTLNRLLDHRLAYLAIPTLDQSVGNLLEQTLFPFARAVNLRARSFQPAEVTSYSPSFSKIMCNERFFALDFIVWPAQERASNSTT